MPYTVKPCYRCGNNYFYVQKYRGETIEVCSVCGRYFKSNTPASQYRYGEKKTLPKEFYNNIYVGKKKDKE